MWAGAGLRIRANFRCAVAGVAGEHGRSLDTTPTLKMSLHALPAGLFGDAVLRCLWWVLQG